MANTTSLYDRYMADKKAHNLGIVPQWNKNGNIKLGESMWTLSTLYGSHEWYIEKLDRVINGTCGRYCAGCEKICYVRRSYRYNSVKYGHARNTIAIRENILNAFFYLNEKIENARNKPVIIRYDQSGEIESIEQLQMYASIAWVHMDIDFYIYTKAYDIVIPALLDGMIPMNMTVNISIYHEYGIEEFKRVAHLPNVKAFVVLDDEWTIAKYAEYGIIITTTCKAYNEKGNLDHNITCDKCKKCFNRIMMHKVIGCYEH